MLGRRYLPLYAAQHMTDAHQMVINHMRKMVRRIAVRLDNHRVPLDLGHIIGHPSKNHILELHALRVSRVHLEPNTELLILGQPLCQLHGCQMATAVVVARHLACLQRLLAQQLQPALRAEAIVRRAILDQLLYVRMVHSQSFALHVRTVGACG